MQNWWSNNRDHSEFIPHWCLNSQVSLHIPDIHNLGHSNLTSYGGHNC